MNTEHYMYGGGRNCGKSYMTREHIKQIINENTSTLNDGYYHATIVLNICQPHERRIPALRGYLDSLLEDLENALKNHPNAIFLVEVDECNRHFSTTEYTGRKSTFWVY